jgi:hypothetical protein
MLGRVQEAREGGAQSRTRGFPEMEWRGPPSDDAPHVRSRPRRILRLAGRAALALVALLVIAWGSVALAIDGPGRGAAYAYALVSAGVFGLVRPRYRGVLACFGLFFLVLAWWLGIAPRNDREWLPDVSRLAAARVEGDRMTVRNVRNFEYRSETDVTAQWEERTYDLSKVVGMDLFVCDWGAKGIVHTIASWEFQDGEHLAVSIETRKEVGETYSAVRGFFRQFELYYAVGDERDLIGVRAGLRGERVRLHRIAGTPEQARALLVDYMRRVDALNAEAAWYNAFTQNCTTSIRLHAVDIGIERPWDWRILVNGRGEELLYSRGQVNTSVPFDELRARSDVTAAARAALGEPDFSRIIRRDVLPRPDGP